jgi:hypothetical protein
VNDIARRKRLDLVVQVSPQVVYGHVRVDITDEVIDACRDFFTPDLPLVDAAQEMPQPESLLPEPPIAEGAPDSVVPAVE